MKKYEIVNEYYIELEDDVYYTRYMTSEEWFIKHGNKTVSEYAKKRPYLQIPWEENNCIFIPGSGGGYWIYTQAAFEAKLIHEEQYDCALKDAEYWETKLKDELLDTITDLSNTIYTKQKDSKYAYIPIKGETK